MKKYLLALALSCVAGSAIADLNFEVEKFGKYYRMIGGPIERNVIEFNPCDGNLWLNGDRYKNEKITIKTASNIIIDNGDSFTCQDLIVDGNMQISGKLCVENYAKFIGRNENSVCNYGCICVGIKYFGNNIDNKLYESVKYENVHDGGVFTFYNYGMIFTDETTIKNAKFFNCDANSLLYSSDTIKLDGKCADLFSSVGVVVTKNFSFRQDYESYDEVPFSQYKIFGAWDGYIKTHVLWQHINKNIENSTGSNVSKRSASDSSRRAEAKKPSVAKKLSVAIDKPHVATVSRDDSFDATVDAPLLKPYDSLLPSLRGETYAVLKSIKDKKIGVSLEDDDIVTFSIQQPADNYELDRAGKEGKLLLRHQSLITNLFEANYVQQSIELTCKSIDLTTGKTTELNKVSTCYSIHGEGKSWSPDCNVSPRIITNVTKPHLVFVQTTFGECSGMDGHAPILNGCTMPSGKRTDIILWIPSTDNKYTKLYRKEILIDKLTSNLSKDYKKLGGLNLLSDVLNCVDRVPLR